MASAPPRVWAVFIAALVYVLFPYDLLPDIIPFIGWIDDLILLAAAGAALWVSSPKRKKTSRSEPEPDPGHDPEPEPDFKPDPEPDSADSTDPSDPYSVLGVRRGASADEIKRAYREQMALYHPDKVAHLGPDLKKLAEEKARAIHAAYEELTGAR